LVDCYDCYGGGCFFIALEYTLRHINAILNASGSLRTDMLLIFFFLRNFSCCVMKYMGERRRGGSAGRIAIVQLILCVT
jgi:hypothetical protein